MKGRPNAQLVLSQTEREQLEALLRISANVTDDFGNVTGLSGRCRVAWNGL